MKNENEGKEKDRNSGALWGVRKPFFFAALKVEDKCIV